MLSFLRSQAELMAASDPELVGARKKTFSQRFCVGISCLLYLLVTMDCWAGGDKWTAVLYTVVAVMSLVGDTNAALLLESTGAIRKHSADVLNSVANIMDRWSATLGAVRVFYCVACELLWYRNMVNGCFEIGLVIVIFPLLSKSRSVAKMGDWGWRWVFWHSAWHVASVLGAIYGLRCERAHN